MANKCRQLNIELLRIVAMFLVLGVHVNYAAIGAPTKNDIISYPLSSFLRLEFQALSLVCVNVFVLISGYFGIRPKLKGICHFLYQIIFWQVLIYFVLYLFGDINFTVASFLRLFIPYYELWFVWAYLGLILVSPLLNSFIENTTKNQLAKYIAIFYVLQFIFGWLIPKWAWYGGGYSTISFVGLYLLARYMKLYSPKWTSYRRIWYLLGYFIVTTIAALFVLIMFNISDNIAVLDRLHQYYSQYTSPQTVLGSVCIFLFFTKLAINNKAVNWFAVSAFAVYLVNCNPFIWNKYLDVSKFIYYNFDSFFYICYITAFICTVFFACIILDKLRIISWNGILWIVDKARSRL